MRSRPILLALGWSLVLLAEVVAQDTKCLGPGAFVVAPANAAHSVWAAGPVEYQVHGVGPFDMTYTNAADDPRQRPQ